MKAQEVFKHHTDSFVIGSDTLVFLNYEVFGKPKSPEDAFRMLKSRQGNWHEVYTGITIFNPKANQETQPFACDALATKVYMRPLSDAEIHA